MNKNGKNKKYMKKKKKAQKKYAQKALKKGIPLPPPQLRKKRTTKKRHTVLCVPCSRSAGFGSNPYTSRLTLASSNCPLDFTPSFLRSFREGSRVAPAGMEGRIVGWAGLGGRATVTSRIPYVSKSKCNPAIWMKISMNKNSSD